MRNLLLVGCAVVFALIGKGDPFPASVDVLIAGGTAAAVEAACAAKKSGESVFIVSPRPYFGEDTAGRFELEPIPAEDEPVSVKGDFTISAGGAKARTSVSFAEPTEVTRIEVVTEERNWKDKAARTKECHYICRGPDEKAFSPVRPLDVVMNYSPGGKYLWRAALNRRVKELAVGATRADDAQDLRVVELRVFRKAAPDAKRRPTPLEAKCALDAKLTAAGVPFVTGAMGIDVLKDASGRVTGAVFATRGGVKQVRAKTVVDASLHGVLVRAAGGRLKPLPRRMRLSRVVLSASRPSADGLTVEELDGVWPVQVQRRKRANEPVEGRLYRCSFDWETDDTVAGWAAAEMRTRELTWSPDLLDAADELAFPPRVCEETVPGLVYLQPSSTTPKTSTSNLQPPTFNLSSDVCVVGAGTAGAPATIAAVRAGAKTVAVEYMYGLGGLGTMGMIGYYWYGTVCGFTKEVEDGIAALGARVPGVGKREWWRREAAKATVLFGSMAYDVVKEGDAVVGVKVATPFGAGIVRARVTVDATGAADLAAAAGERTDYIGADELAMQSAGLPPRVPGFTYVNSDFGYANDNDPSDTTLFGLRGRRGAQGEWDVAQIVGTRERRRLVGGFQVQPEDVINERTFPDTIATGSTDFDTHGPTVADVCFLSPATDKHVFKLNIPYRALLPAKADGLVVCGIGASGHRDAMPFMRMQADVQNEGYAAGRAAAMAAKGGVSPRQIDVRDLQRHLADIGSIPKAALEWKDNFPLSDADWKSAVAAVGDGFKGAPLVLTDKPRARRDLHAAFLNETDPLRRVAFAQILGMLGDDVGADVLVEHLSQKDYQPVVSDKAKRFGKRMGGRDAELVALGRTRSPKAVPLVRKEIEGLRTSTGSSHVRALALACLALRDATLAPALAKALRTKKLGGHAVASASALPPLGGFARTIGGYERMACVRELALARALVACGDSEGLGRRTLEAYARDPRGVYAAHARAVLATLPAAAAGVLYPASAVRTTGLCGAKLTTQDGSLVVKVKAHEPWSGVRVNLASPVDMTRHGRMIAVVSNRTARTLGLNIHAKTPEVANKFLSGGVLLAPLAVGSLVVDSAATKTRPSDVILPGVRDYEEPLRSDTFDPARIGLVNVFCDPQEDPAEFALLKLSVEDDDANCPRRLADDGGFFPFVDKYGQFRHEDWPGKTHDDADLATARRDEEAFLSAHADWAILDADRFGGWAKGPQLKATGFFRTEQVDGKWWFVDPDGHLFYSQGVNAIFTPDRTGVTGREKFFAELPDRTDKTFAACWGRTKKGTVRGYYKTHFPFDTFSFGTANMIRKYGSDWWTSFTDLPHRRMRAWGLNTIGNWSSRGVTEKSRTVYTDLFSTRSRPICGNDGFWRKFPDVFAPEFQANAEADAAKLAKRSGTDPWCLGWFVDNELSWGGDDRMLAKDVLASPDDQPAKIEFLKILAAKGIDPEKVPDAELAAFTRHLADRYFTVVREAVKKAAPNRLYLGCRLAWGCPAVWKSAAEYCDVVSVNAYGKLPQKKEMKYVAAKPILIGEFHFGALDRGSLSAGLVPTASQLDRAEHYKAYVRAALASSQIIGAHWFLWADQPLTGRFDGECYQTGLVDVTDRPYPEMVAAMRELAREIYR